MSIDVSILRGLHHKKGENDMKKVLLLFIIFFSITSFSSCEDDRKVYQDEGTVCEDQGKEDVIEYESGIYHNKNWEESACTYQGAVIPDKKTALEIATIIFNRMRKSNATQKYVPQSVFYDEQDEIWIVSFWRDTDELILGGDCSIAMQKQDGKVLRIWFGE